MKKELTLAILVGLVLGFTITGLIWTKKRGKSTSTPSQKNVTPTVTQTVKKTEKANQIFLNIKEPKNESIISQEKLTIKGNTLVNATVVLVWEEGENILVADKDGNFQTEITLVGGENEIEISAYDEDGNQANEILTITYSTAKF